MATLKSLKLMVIEILQSKQGEQLKPSEIAAQIAQEFPAYCEKKIKSTTQNDLNLVKQIANQISASAKQWMLHLPQLKCSEETPRTYWWEPLELVDVDSFDAPQASVKSSGDLKTAEKALYGKLATYLAGMRPRKLYPKRINEGTSSNTNGKNGNKHLHPDMVAMEDLMPKPVWSDEVRKWAAATGATQAKLWSFEVKVDLQSISEAREGYLQALANSAWANFGYLVAKQISDKAFNELKMLHDVHGLGVILLDVDNPADDSIIKLAAREKSQFDWGTCNRIADQNLDFRKFIELVAEFHALGKTREVDWDFSKVSQPAVL